MTRCVLSKKSVRVTPTLDPSIALDHLRSSMVTMVFCRLVGLRRVAVGGIRHGIHAEQKPPQSKGRKSSDYCSLIPKLIFRG